MKERFSWKVHPLAEKSQMVTGKCFRFTVLAPALLRLEYSADGVFEDRASQVVFYRDLPPCPYTCTREGGYLQIDTQLLQLRYLENAPFDASSLSIRLKQEPASAWCFGEEFETLGGTCKTLDNVDGRCAVEEGVCSRNGFSVLDDSHTLLLEDGWFGLRQEGNSDHYFFGYGYDYLGSVRALYQLTGAPPMLPAYALGNWWSRYFAYTQQEYLELMERFRKEDLPFSVAVVDMDWHITQIPEDQKDPDPRIGRGWTGYTWNEELFPDYKQFLNRLHELGLKTALNLHPAVGTCCHEKMYPQMALANGIDPATGRRVPLDVLSPAHMCTYFDILHHPYENDGVDFWWMDWQQGRNYWWIHEPNPEGEYKEPLERMDPLWILNHLHILDISRDGKRPMFFSRFSGPGSHRYPVGFSGDTSITWESLSFQPEFTAMASNIGYSWWSHDIGGHQRGICDEVLYIRWLQLGVFSPINRLHSTRNPFMNKEPFCHAPHIGAVAGDLLRLRHQLFPYLYTMNWRNHRALQPLVQPMYYTHPKCNEAYKAVNQYWFGSELMVCPITQPNDAVTGLGSARVWLPKGLWFDWFTGLVYDGLKGRTLEVYRPLERMPVFAKAGAIVPMAEHTPGSNLLCNTETVQVLVFPGASNSFTLYEDAGEGSDYQGGAFATTWLELCWGEGAVFTVHPAQGDLTRIPQSRTWRIGLRGFHKDAYVEGGAWEAETNTWWVTRQARCDESITVTVSGERLIHDNADVLQRCDAVLRASQIPYEIKLMLWNRVKDGGKLSLLAHAGQVLGLGSPAAKPLVELLCLTKEIRPAK